MAPVRADHDQIDFRLFHRAGDSQLGEPLAGNDVDANAGLVGLIDKSLGSIGGVASVIPKPFFVAAGRHEADGLGEIVGVADQKFRVVLLRQLQRVLEDPL